MRIDDRMVFEIIGELSDVETSLWVQAFGICPAWGSPGSGCPMVGLAWLKRMVSARKSSRRSSTSTSARRFVVCVRNAGYAASLEQNKIYVAIPDEAAESHGQIRVVDESGEDYLFSADRFVAIEVPAAV